MLESGKDGEGDVVVWYDRSGRSEKTSKSVEGSVTVRISASPCIKVEACRTACDIRLSLPAQVSFQFQQVHRLPVCPQIPFNLIVVAILRLSQLQGHYHRAHFLVVFVLPNPPLVELCLVRAITGKSVLVVPAVLEAESSYLASKLYFPLINLRTSLSGLPSLI